MKNLLDEIMKENDIKNIDPRDYKELAKEIRRELVLSVSKTGGHLASNLGAVELTMALHLFLDFPEDKLVWDVGHQSYTHKLLTGRKDVFCSLRSFGGISGFPKVSENPADTFDTGHSSTSLSVALGLANARDLQGGQEKVVAVIGDGALTGGMAFEALNNAAQLRTGLIIILNDNKMSIAPNVGGMSTYLGTIRTNKKYNTLKAEVEKSLDLIPNMGPRIAEKMKRVKDSAKRLFVPGMLFEDMGLTYIGPVNGHNLSDLQTALNAAAEKWEPVIIHVVTKKGKGYFHAEERPSDFHGVEPFYVKTGEPKTVSDEVTYTNIFGDWMMDKVKEDDRLVAVSAAMPYGTGLKQFSKEYPERLFDVGIAEEHAVTFAAGMAAGGMKPVVALYSTFLQRAYDQMLHDVCLGNQSVIFAIDRSGLVGKDGETHQGIFDISFLSTMPNLTIMSPVDEAEMRACFDYAYDEMDSPVVIRYPRGKVLEIPEDMNRSEVEYGKAEVLSQGRETVILSLGNMMDTALELKNYMDQKKMKNSLVNVRFVKPFDEELLQELSKTHKNLIVLEENVKTGSFGQQIFAYAREHNIFSGKVMHICLPDQFIEHGTPEELREKYQIDGDGAIRRLKEQWDL